MSESVPIMFSSVFDTRLDISDFSVTFCCYVGENLEEWSKWIESADAL